MSLWFSLRPRGAQAQTSRDTAAGGVRSGQNKLLRLRYLGLLGIGIAILLPMFVRQITTGIAITLPTQYNTAFGGVIAMALGMLAYRRLHVFPGIAAGNYIVMSFTATFGALAIALFLMRIDYSRVQFLSSYILTLVVHIYIHLNVAVHRRVRLGVVPSAATLDLPRLQQVDWVPLHLDGCEAEAGVDAIVVDLHTDHNDAWDAQITRFVLHGIPVYHFKQAIEQLSGRVEIYQLSENTLGSLNPNDVYLKVKAFADAVISAALLLLLSPFLLLVCVLVRLDSPGPAIFRQQRTGFRGRPFTVYKIRTMYDASAGASASEQRQAAMTDEGDPRITRLGGLLRRTRIDELPQLVNIIKGDMSLIGPRPEAIALTHWYEKEIPFYHYRHLIKPGLTGWAQVNQGHVTDVSDVKEKLYLDFYYVKNFSFWLDILIAIRTVGIMISGHGAR